MAGNDKILEQVIDVLEGRVVGQDAEAVLHLVALETDWAAAHEWVREFLAAAEGSTLQPVPPSTRAMLERLLPERRSAADGVRDIVQSIARLVPQRSTGAAFAGARGAASALRQAHFATDDGIDVVIELEDGGDHLVLSGQVLGGERPIVVHPISDQSMEPIEADEFGEFRMTLTDTAFLRLDLVSSTSHTVLDLTALLDPED